MLSIGAFFMLVREILVKFRDVHEGICGMFFFMLGTVYVDSRDFYVGKEGLVRLRDVQGRCGMSF